MKMEINGVKQEVNSKKDAKLLWYLREEAKLTGTKFGCGMGVCGSCTVHINGNPVRSCQVNVSDLADEKITTIEGISKDLSHPVQKAWIAEQVPQCGYCQSGQIMSAAALLATNNRPSDAEIDRAMAGNYCRCGTYIRIRDAIHTAALAYNADGGARK